MAASVQIPIAEYLKTYYRPDREYVDGEVVERNLGAWEHGRVQTLLAIWFGAHESDWGVMVASEWRARVSPTRVRIPDVTIVLAGLQSPVLEEAPLLAIEILSPEDTWSGTQRKCLDYNQMGVKTNWIIDPGTRTGRLASAPIGSKRPAWKFPAARSTSISLPSSPPFTSRTASASILFAHVLW